MQHTTRIAPIRLFVTLAVAASLLVAKADATTFATALQTGTVQNSGVGEASGLIASRLNPNVLWTHNDSGNSARVYPMSTAGANLGTYTVSGASNLDWEDIAVGPGPTAGQQYLYIADIGDNAAARSNVSVYRLPEPIVSDTQAPVTTTLSGAEKLTFKYPDGARDAESMFVDPATRDIYIISKRENPHHVYRAAYPQSTSGTTTLELVTTFSTTSDWLTAADISPDGNEILVRDTESNSGRLYARPAGGTIGSAFGATPMTIPLAAEQQGEAITFDPNGHGYYTTSEGNSQPVFYFDRLAPPPGAMYWDADGVATGSRAATGAGTGGTGTWNSALLRWYNGSAELAWSGGDDAIFRGTAGTVTLAAPQTANSLAFKTDGYSITGSTLTLTGGTVIVDANLSATVNSTVAGAASLTKSGAGTLALTQANTYSGGTTISAGTLLVTNTAGSATGAGQVNVVSAARLGGTGTVGGDLENSGTISPGTSAGTLHVGGLFSQTASGRLEIDLASVAAYDKLEVVGTADLGGTLAVVLLGGFTPTAGATFQIVAASSFSSSVFQQTDLPSLPGSLAWTIDYGATAVTLHVGLAGDFNVDGVVDAADYVVWRAGLGSVFTEADYHVWRGNVGVSIGSTTAAQLAAVPESAAAMLTLMATATAIAVGRRQHRLF